MYSVIKAVCRSVVLCHFTWLEAAYSWTQWILLWTFWKGIKNRKELGKGEITLKVHVKARKDFPGGEVQYYLQRYFLILSHSNIRSNLLCIFTLMRCQYGKKYGSNVMVWWWRSSYPWNYNLDNLTFLECFFPEQFSVCLGSSY